MSIRNMILPFGPLYEHMSPPNETGLSTSGWDRKIHTGCFSIINLEFWHTEMIQDFLHHVLRIGADIDQRWTEQVNQRSVDISRVGLLDF
jgi:hypothetical protein